MKGHEQRHQAELECPNCGSANVKTRVLRDEFQYGSGEKSVKLAAHVPFRTCAACGFEYTDSEAEDLRHDAICRHLGVMPPREIEGVRRQYLLSRAQFALETKIGEASLARWETAQIIQNPANDNYLFLLTFPENMDRLRARCASGAVKENAAASAAHNAEAQSLAAQAPVRNHRSRFRALRDAQVAEREARSFRLRQNVR